MVMPRYRIEKTDLVKLEGEGYRVHASIGGEYIAALIHILTRDLIWDHAPEFSRVLDICQKSPLTAHELMALHEQGMALTDAESAMISQFRASSADNSGGTPC